MFGAFVVCYSDRRINQLAEGGMVGLKKLSYPLILYISNTKDCVLIFIIALNFRLLVKTDLQSAVMEQYLIKAPFISHFENLF